MAPKGEHKMSLFLVELFVHEAISRTFMHETSPNSTLCILTIVLQTEWDPDGAMKLDFGGDQRPIDKVCREVSDGVFERKFEKLTVQLDCNNFTARFIPANNAPAQAPAKGGYGGLGMKLGRVGEK